MATLQSSTYEKDLAKKLDDMLEALTSVESCLDTFDEINPIFEDVQADRGLLVSATQHFQVDYCLGHPFKCLDYRLWLQAARVHPGTLSILI